MTTEQRLRSKNLAIVATVAVFSAVAPVSAHRLDELLQAARIGIAEDRVELELDLTPGVAVADRLIAEIDRDGDARFSSEEQRAFVDGAFAAIVMTADDARLKLSVTSIDFPDADSLRTGNASIAVRAAAQLPVIANGTHHIGFDNRYRGDASVYLANALVPESDRISVTAQDRDRDQQQLTIHYDVTAGSSLPALGILLVVFAVTAAGVATSRASVSR